MRWTQLVVLVAGVLLPMPEVPAAERVNLARMEGVTVLVDSQNRDRWGVDGFHASCVNDGVTRPPSAAQVWMSDNWEVTHAVVLAFPQRVIVSEVVVHWWNNATPRHYLIQGLTEGKWSDLALATTTKEETRSSHSFAPTTVEALRVLQPPHGAPPAADRRLQVAEVEVFGEVAQPVRAVNVVAALRAELASQREAELVALAKPQLDLVTKSRKTRGSMGIINREDVQRGRANIATRAWAKAYADAVKADADWWVQQTDDYIYGLVPVGNPRALCPQFEKGCPIHGGARGSFDATLEAPYRWRCRHGGEQWHDGAVVKNPGTGADVTVRDDGSGFLTPPGFPNAGRRYYFVAAYRYFLLGKLFSSPYEPDGGSKYQGGTPVLQLALAYAFTGDARYAHKCAVMLNRLAELYRTYDGCIEGPSQRQDGYIGQTFERFLAQNLILACDLIWDEVEKDSALRDLFAAKGDCDYDHDGKVTGADLTFNLQHNLLGYIYEYLHRLMPYMDGDFLMYEMTAMTALSSVLRNADLAAETLESDLGLRVMLTNEWFRDGKFVYDSCGYNVGNAKTPLAIAEWMHGFQAPPKYPKPLDLYHDRQYRMEALFDFCRHIDCDGRLPQIGDGGGSRSQSLRTTPPYDPYDERALLRLPEQRDFYLQRLQAAAGGDLEAYRNGRADWWLVFHAGPPMTESPAPSAVPAANRKSEIGKPKSHLFPDSGIALLRAGKDPATRQHLALTFSKGSYGHGHPDKLAINVIRYGFDFSGDLGYPTTWTDIKYGGWEANTASHCLVMLDEQGQTGHRVGTLNYFVTEPMADVVEACAERAAYPAASLYRRTVALVRDEAGQPFYTVDLFRVAGAMTRDYLFHSLGKPEDMTVALADKTAAWVAQPKGSLAGPDVEPMTRGGYAFLSEIQRVRSDGGCVATWRPTSGTSQPDRYLLTRDTYRDYVVEFTMTRLGKASGPQERSVFVVGADPSNQGNRRTFFLDAGGSLPIGKPQRVRVEVSAGQASVTFNGELKPVRVDIAGSPPELGAVGFLHYYNYAYTYDDFVLTPRDVNTPAIKDDFSKSLNPRVWAMVDPTYTVSNGQLVVRDAEDVGFALHMVGAAGREIIKAKAEGYGVRGTAPLEGHLIVRDHFEDRTKGSVFAAVLEAFKGQPHVVSVDPMTVVRKPGIALASNPEPVRALRIRAEGRTDYVLSCLDPSVPIVAKLDEIEIEFRGRFGLVATHEGKVASLTAIGGGWLRCGKQSLEVPGDVRGRIVAVELNGETLTVELSGGGTMAEPKSLRGRHVLVHNPAFLCPAIYEIVEVKPIAARRWRLKVNIPFVLARGIVKSVDREKGSFATRTPVMKLRVNPGLFDGKRVRPRLADDAPEFALTSATEAAFVLNDRNGLRHFAAGSEYVVLDVGVGDEVEVVSSATKPCRSV